MPYHPLYNVARVFSIVQMPESLLSQDNKYLDEIAKKVGDLQQIALAANEVRH